MRKPATGFLYVLEVTGGLIKVGFSLAPDVRTSKHATVLKKADLEIVRRWISSRHVEAGLNEEVLIAECERLGGTRYGSEKAREWFTDLRFDDVVAAAEHLDSTMPEGDQPMTIEQARSKLGDLVRDAQQHGITTLITRNGKPAAVLVPAEATQPDRSTTERGFMIYDRFTDRYGSQVRVQESSSAMEPCVWIFSQRPDGEDGHAPHLNVEQAKRVRDALDAFISEHAGSTA